MEDGKEGTEDGPEDEACDVPISPVNISRGASRYC